MRPNTSVGECPDDGHIDPGEGEAWPEERPARRAEAKVRVTSELRDCSLRAERSGSLNFDSSPTS